MQVRTAWGVPGAVGLGAWPSIMRAYYGAAANPRGWEVQAEHGPPAVAGEAFARLPQAEGGPSADGSQASGGGAPGEAEEQEEEEGAEGSSRGASAAAPAAPRVEYPAGGYWGLDPGMRVGMLYALAHDALQTWPMRCAGGRAAVPAVPAVGTAVPAGLCVFLLRQPENALLLLPPLLGSPSVAPFHQTALLRPSSP